MAGRNQIPREIKKLQGTLQKCRDTGLITNGELLISAPDAPAWLTDQAKEIYADTCNDLLTMKMLTNTNIRLIISYSNFLAKHLDIEEQLANQGIMSNIVTFRDSKGEINKIQVNALAKISMDSFVQSMKIATEFGLTPASKGRVPRIEKPQANIVDLFTNLTED